MPNSSPYQKIHVVINPVSGKDKPIINALNDVLHQYGVDWLVSITKKYGDAIEQAIARGGWWLGTAAPAGSITLQRCVEWAVRKFRWAFCRAAVEAL